MALLKNVLFLIYFVLWKVYHKTVLVGGAWRTSNTRFPEYHVESVEKVFFVFLFSLSFSLLFFVISECFCYDFEILNKFTNLGTFFLPISGYFDFVIFNFKFRFRFKFLQQILQTMLAERRRKTFYSNPRGTIWANGLFLSSL